MTGMVESWVTLTPPSLCPRCGHTLTAAGAVGDAGARPGAGDFTLCIGCAGVLVYDAHLRVRLPLAGELEAARAEDPEFAADLDRQILGIRSLPLRPPRKSDRRH